MRRERGWGPLGLPGVREILLLLGYAASYALAFALGRSTVLENSGFAAFWPAAGVATLWLLRGRSPRELAVDVAALGALHMWLTVLVGYSLSSSVLFAVANVVHPLTVRAVLARLDRVPVLGPLPRRMATVRDLMSLVAAVLVGAVVSSPIGITAAALSAQPGWMSELLWVVRNAAGTLVVAAAAMAVMTALRQPGPDGRLALTAEPRRYAVAELVLLVLTTGVLGIGVFAGGLPVAFILLATSVWAGFRFSPVVATLHTFALATLAIHYTAIGEGPFRTIPDLGERALVVQLFLAMTMVIVLLLSLGVAERAQLHAAAVASEAAAQARAGLLDAVTTAMFEGLVVVDADGQVVIANPAARAIAGISAGTAVPAVQFQDIDGAPVTVATLPTDRALHGEHVPPTDVLLVDPSTGQQHTVSVAATPLRLSPDPSGRLAVVVLRDVTADRAHRRELQSFAGVVAHDLKSPLTGVRSWAELAQEQLAELGDTAAEPRSSVDRVIRSGLRMQLLIDDLLTYTRAQNAQVESRPVDLDALVDSSAKGLREGHPGRRIVIEHDTLGWVHADPALVGRLVDNLLGNAVKYVAPDVVPHVTVTSRRLGDWLEVRVSDNGIGIPPAERGKVFDSFYRVHLPDHYSGTGLGLAICARTVERHGGRIAAVAGPGGRGTTIVFTLPLEPSAAPQARDAAGLPVRATGTPSP